MKTSPTKLIVLHPSLYKHTSPSPRLWLFAFFSLFSFTFLLTLLKHSSSYPPPSTTTTTTSPSDHHPKLPTTISTALLHYATHSNITSMTPSELTLISTSLLTCPSPCHFLIFGLTPESPLWLSLNHHPNSRTVFLDENEYLIAKYEANYTDFEGYDVQYTTKMAKSKELIRYARAHRKGECRPVQNLLFSECKLAINDLPNHLYEIPWDLILVDGPSGYSPSTPGRMSAIYSAAVMGRSKRGGERRKTHVFVHDYGREVERVFSEEFLCKENLVEVKDSLAHFVIEDVKDNGRFEFCTAGGGKSTSE